MEYSVFKPKPIYRRHTNFAIEYTEKNINENHDKPLIPIDTTNTLLGIQHKITKELPIPNKIISPWNVIKPIIIFFEPFDIMIKDTTKYLQETKMTQNELLSKYDIDYESFFNSNIRDEEGYLELLQSKEDIHIFLLDYINN